MKEKIIQQWEANADAYASLIDGKGTPHQRIILLPSIRRLMGNVSGKDLLDAGCGEGYLDRLLVKEGANVTGIDISSRLIRTCIERAKEEGLQIQYKVMDICDLIEIPAGSFDVILSNLVLLNVPCLDTALKGFYRVLKPDGVAIVSIVHPAFNFYGPGKWELGEKDPTTRRRRGIHFIVNQYFEEMPYEKYWRTRDGEKFPQPITFFHRTFSSYFNAARNAGFIIDAIEEPIPETDDPFFERERRIPVFLLLRLKKP
ncbi:MAG: class I SAM-dependent methyltransferase [Candidatus Thorarchaeota archaeon]